MLLRSLFAVCLLAVTSACASMEIEDFDDQTPTFVLEDYFEGKTRAYGIFEDRGGAIRTRFQVDIIGRWDGDTFLLEEEFVYANGTKEFYVWKIKKTGANTYEGYREGVVGKALGVSNGNALNWSYTLDLEMDDSTLRLDFDDWMFLMSDKTLLNRARVTKFGIMVGSVTLTFEKL